MAGLSKDQTAHFLIGRPLVSLGRPFLLPGAGFAATVPCHNGSTMSFRTANNDHLKKGKTPPPEETHEEAAYLKMLGEKQKPVRIKLVDGEIVKGWIEYYDRSMVRLTREGAPNLFIYKHDIRYISEEPVKKARPENGKTAEPARAE
jgi:host factor-I protein